MRKLLFIIYLITFSGTNQLIHSQVTDSGTHEKWEYVLEDSGDIIMVALPAIAGFTTIYKKDWKGTKQFAFSFATGFVITHSLKRIVHKQRPEGRLLYDSFPSGHTSSAFSGASFIQRRYGWKYGKYAYILAAVVGVSQMEGPDGWHDIWDVLSGAAVGIGSTYLFTTPYQKKNVSLNCNASKDSFLLSFQVRF